MLEKLSERETDVAFMIRKGLTNKEIAYTIGISQRRVGAIISSIKDKFQLSSKVEIAILVHPYYENHPSKEVTK